MNADRNHIIGTQRMTLTDGDLGLDNYDFRTGSAAFALPPREMPLGEVFIRDGLIEELLIFLALLSLAEDAR